MAHSRVVPDRQRRCAAVAERKLIADSRAPTSPSHGRLRSRCTVHFSNPQLDGAREEAVTMLQQAELVNCHFLAKPPVPRILLERPRAHCER
eukprot:1443969-Pyramimonas_sp.AAC.1